MKLNKNKIEELANEIIAFLKKHGLQDSVCIYYNNKRWRIKSEYLGDGKFSEEEIIEDNMNPFDYFEYANEKHILSMSFEGGLYDVLNYTFGKREEQFLAIFEKYDLCYELGNSWNLTVYPENGNYEDIEYTPYETEPDPIMIYWHTTENIPEELIAIKAKWNELSATTQHLGGSCVIGDGFEFRYQGIRYKMSTPPYQGSLIYEHWIDDIKKELKTIGATEVYYDYGRMD